MSDNKPENKPSHATAHERDAARPDAQTRAAANDPGPEAQPTEPQTAAGGDARHDALEAELAAKTAELAAFKESALRQLAEQQNLRRRAENEMADARKYGAASFARDALAIADNLKRALDAAAVPSADDAARAKAFEGLRQGVELIDREFAAILERHGIKRIDPRNEKFDPNFHQAMFEVEAATIDPGTVVEVVQPGYRLHDRLLRPALVGVSKAKSPPAAPDAEAPGS
jgi:molecular chaperone GrpE